MEALVWAAVFQRGQKGRRYVMEHAIDDTHEHLRRLAFQFAAQLPESQHEAVVVLALMEELIAWRHGGTHAARAALLENRRFSQPIRRGGDEGGAEAQRTPCRLVVRD